jgi:hypothetical protein
MMAEDMSEEETRYALQLLLARIPPLLPESTEEAAE